MNVDSETAGSFKTIGLWRNVYKLSKSCTLPLFQKWYPCILFFCKFKKKISQNSSHEINWVTWNLFPLGWLHNIRVSNVGLKAKGVLSDLVVDLGASIWLAYTIKKNWRKKSEKMRDNLFGAQEKLSKNSAYLRNIEILMTFFLFRMNYLYFKISYKQISKFPIYLYSISIISFYNYEWLRILSHIKIIKICVPRAYIFKTLSHFGKPYTFPH